MEWRVICVTCGEELDRANNGHMMEVQGRMVHHGEMYGQEHHKGHDIIVGFTTDEPTSSMEVAK